MGIITFNQTEIRDDIEDNAMTFRRTITNADDIDTLQETSIYRVTSDSNLPQNWPITKRGMLIVFSGAKSGSTVFGLTTQIVASSAGDSFAYRQIISNVWQPWIHVANKDDVDEAFGNSLSYRRHLVQTDDLNTITDMGVYRATNEATQAQNWPLSGPGLLLVFRSNVPSDSGTGQTTQIVFGTSRVVYRKLSGGVWPEWIDFTINSRGNPDYLRSKEYGVFGLSLNPLTGVHTRLGEASDMEFAQQVGSDVAKSDFDYCFPWNAMRECNISFQSGNPVIKYEGESGFSRSNNTFIEVPKFYFKRVVRNNVESWYVSGVKASGFQVEPWFLDDNGDEVDFRYIGKYNISDDKVSATGGVPVRSKTASEFRTICEADGFNLASIHAYLALQHLLIVEYGTFNSKSINSGISYYPYASHSECTAMLSTTGNTIRLPYNVRNTYFDQGDLIYVEDSFGELTNPRHVVSVSVNGTQSVDITFDGNPVTITAGTTRLYGSSQPNGRTDSLTYQNAREGGSALTRAFKYRGIENLYGNCGELMDRCSYNCANQTITVDGVELPFGTPYNSEYIAADGTAPGFITKLGIDKSRPSLTLPTALSGYYSSPFYDEWSSMTSETATSSSISFGCGWDHWVGNGIMTMRATNSNWLTGARAEY